MIASRRWRAISTANVVGFWKLSPSSAVALSLVLRDPIRPSATVDIRRPPGVRVRRPTATTGLVGRLSLDHETRYATAIVAGHDELRLRAQALRFPAEASGGKVAPAWKVDRTGYFA